MLICFEAFLAFVLRNQLNLLMGQPTSGQVGQHLVTEQMGDDVLGDARLFKVLLNDLLPAPWGVSPSRT